MTRDEILALKPGRETDARVAGELGWGGFYTDADGRLFGIHPLLRLSYPNDTEVVPRYSTCISEAVKLWQHLQSTGIDGKEVALQIAVRHDRKVEAEIMAGEDSVAWVDAVDTIAGAITKVWLIAKGEGE